MAAGDIFNARLTVTTTRATLDTLVGAGAKTYSYVRLVPTGGSVCMGNSSVTEANGERLAVQAAFEPLLNLGEVILNSGTIIGANINLIGAGTVDFFGITSA